MHNKKPAKENKTDESNNTNTSKRKFKNIL